CQGMGGLLGAGIGAQGATQSMAPSGPARCLLLRPHCRIGVIADVQWCDIEDGWNYKKTERRAYRGALQAFRRASSWWNDGPDLAVVAQLGDLIDGQCARLGLTATCFDRAREVLDTIRAPTVLNLIGNHELYNFSFDALAEQLNTRRGGLDYYSHSPAPGLRLLVLNGYELSVIGRERGDERYEGALKLLKANNPNDVEQPGDFTKGLV
ncbi:unnamed protein product, partial [Polarella glacialis]